MKLLSFLFVPAVLVVLVAANLKILPPESPHVHDLTAGSKKPVSFLCQAPDLTTAEAELKWYNDADQEITATSGNIFISDEGRKLLLRIIAPTDEDAGTYTCKGLIEGVETEASISLELYRGINVTSPTTQYAVKGTDAKIWCRMVQTNVEKDVFWFKGDWERIRSNDKYHVGYETAAGEEGDYLQINDIQLEDSGQYICNVEMFNIGESAATFITVVVTVPPKMTKPITFNPVVPMEGDRLVMSCEATGTPSPTYMFRKGGQDLLEEPNTDGEYIIESVKRTDEGDYECVATNKGGRDTSTVELDVKIPPVIVSTDNITDQEDKSVRLKCEATGDPAPSLTWKKKGSESIYPIGPGEEVYVEEEEGTPEQDAETRVYTKALYLVIPTLKPKHASEYVCTASAADVTVEKTFKIDVMYMPNFDNQVTTQFWGWVGSKTNLTCIANGNPEPLIKWTKDGQELSSVNGYVITAGESGVPTRAISYLIPTVDNSNVGNVFGIYKCDAQNKYGTNSEELRFDQASVPGEVGITVQDTRATQLGLTITPPAEDGNQPVTRYLVKYHKLDGGEEKEKTVNRVAGETATKVELEELEPNTQYSIKVYAINNVGQGAERNLMERTADYSAPDRVTVLSAPAGSEAYRYTLRWEVPMTGGADISNYIVEYAEALEVNTQSDPWTAVRVKPETMTVNVQGQSSTKVDLKNLKKNTFYQAKVKASNRIGTSDETVFVFRTGSGGGETKEQVGASEGASSVQAGVAGMVLVVMVTACLQLLC